MYLSLNSASIYYETFGDQHLGTPIVLIHGSTITGREDWQNVVPFLAEHYRVIVPDCRGHGKSSNPHLTYSFKEMAHDTAALIRALGYERAHIIGHSNGGNVALVMLMEFPEVVQTCVPQAANAYVSPDLLEREPRIFDPERVKRESPAWMNQMIASHSATHGNDYWLTLLKLTLDEILAGPNYTTEDLFNVKRPTLVIQGEHDPVNAPGQHAQFMAENIPHAELWLPHAKHNVHYELPFEWVNKILDFLKRRGDDSNEALYRLRREKYADGRETIFEVKFNEGVLSGFVLHPAQVEAAMSAVAANLKETKLYALLPTAQWGLVNRPLIEILGGARSGAEKLTQALLGDVVQILRTDDDGWAQVRLERDGYLGWTRAAALQRCRETEVRAYQAAVSAVVVAELAPAVSEPNVRIGKIPFGVRVRLTESQGDQALIKLPDERVWRVPAEDVWFLEKCPRFDAKGIETTLTLMKRFVGVPYVWGGLSPFGYDCSGFAQTFHAFLGVAIPRDADQQFSAGKMISGEPRPGDLLFFGEGDAVRKITHVAISLGGDDFIHAAGGMMGVTYNSFDSKSAVYSERLKNIFVGARTFNPQR